MNVLYVLHKDPDISLGGVERHSVDLARILSLYGWNVHLMYPSSSFLVIATVTKTGVKKRKIDGNFCDDFMMRNESLDKYFLEALRELSIDIVHFQHFLGLSFSLIDAARHYGAKLFITMHDYFFWCPNYKLLSPLNGIMQFCSYEEDPVKCACCLEILYKRKTHKDFVTQRRAYVNELLSTVDMILFPSQYLYDVFCSLFSYIKEKNMIIEHGIAYQDNVLNPSTNGTMNIAHLGAFTYEKGANRFIDIVRSLNDRKLSKRIQFHILGELGLPLPDELHKCENLSVAGSYRPEDVHFLLKRNHIDLILLLSLWPETYSYTLSEAIVNNIPVISTDLGALRERVPRYEVGYLVPYEKPNPDVLRIIGDFLEYPELLNYFKHKCSRAAKQLPSLFDMADSYISIYQN